MKWLHFVCCFLYTEIDEVRNMILFVSGRCDIPAFYSDWFFNRLHEGYVDVRNPYNEHQISRIILDGNFIDCILFCTKDPSPMLDRLDEISFPFLFHVTLTGYHKDIEPGIPDKRKIIQAVKQLSEKIGKERVIIRYDPILLSPRYQPVYHEKAFASLCEQLQGYVDTYIISFIDLYKNTRKNAARIRLREMTESQMTEIGKRIGQVASRYQVHVQTCAEQIDLHAYGITKGLCIGRDDLKRRLGQDIRLPIGKGVRDTCGCLPTVDIGDYNACAHYCAYCYANYDEKRIRENMRKHDPKSSVLIGHIHAEDHIAIRKDNKKW